MGSGASTEIQREFYLTAAITSTTNSPKKTQLEDVRAEIIRLRRKLHDQNEIFGQINNTIFQDDIKERETQQWATCHAITQRNQHQTTTSVPVCSLFGDAEPRPNDVVQSSHLGNCYLIAAMSVVAEKPELIRRLFPNLIDPQGTLTLNQEVTVLINHQKQWREIVLDPSFPVQKEEEEEEEEEDDEQTKETEEKSTTASTPLHLLYGRSQRNNTYWVSFIEKAYAKIYGSYAALQGGDIAEALSDLTGFPVITMKLQQQQHHHQQQQQKQQQKQQQQTKDKDALCHHHQSGQLMACGFICSDEEAAAKRSTTYVRANHAYSILNVKKVILPATKKKQQQKEIVLVRLRNPWGHLEAGIQYPTLSKEILKFVQQDSSDTNDTNDTSMGDGTFWLEWKEFSKSVNNVYICLNAGVDNTSLLMKRVESVGRWTSTTAGGCSTYPTFRQNPMYSIVPPSNGRLTLTLTQPDIRLKRRQERNEVVKSNVSTADDGTESGFTKLSYNQIGLEVITLDGTTHYQPHHVVVGSYTTIIKSSYWNKRDVTLGPFNVKQNQSLIIIPSTYYPQQKNGFFLSAYFEPNNNNNNNNNSSKEPHYLKLTDILKPIQKVENGSNTNPSQLLSSPSPSSPTSTSTSPSPSTSPVSWYSTIVTGEWSKKKKTSGGHGSTSNSSFGQNPQWQIILPKGIQSTKMTVFLKNDTKSTTNLPLDKSKRVGMGICLYRGVPCIRSSKEYANIETTNIIGAVVYSNAIEIARSETILNKVSNVSNVSEVSDASDVSDVSDVSDESDESDTNDTILLIAACYKTGEEAPFTLEIVSEHEIQLTVAPMKDSRPPPPPPKRKKGDKKRGSKGNTGNKGSKGGKGKGTKKMAGFGGFGKAKKTMVAQTNMYEGLE